MKILGLNGWTERGHDGGAALLIDGKLCFAIEEERLNRRRHAYDCKPTLSIEACMRAASLTLDDIDYFCIGWDFEHLYGLLNKKFISKEEMSTELFGTTKYADKIEYVPHHLAHAYSTILRWQEYLNRIMPPRTGKISQIDSLVIPYADLACSAQVALENIVVQIVSKFAVKYNLKNVCLAGGVGLNCPVASAIEKLPYIEKVFTQPAANDGGVSLGAAIRCAVSKGEIVDFEMIPYVGLGYQDAEIRYCLLCSETQYHRMFEISIHQTHQMLRIWRYLESTP